MNLEKRIEDLIKKYRQNGLTDEVSRLYKEVVNSHEGARHRFLYDILTVDSNLKIDFVKLNNKIIEQNISPNSVKKIMLLLPFCLQDTRCSHRIVWNVDNCVSCGACKIGELKEISHEKHVDLRIAVRSAFAPKFIRESKPDLVLALSCENESVKGILSVPEFPCYCVMIEHPNGFCINTTVDTESVLEIIDKFISFADSEDIAQCDLV